MDDERSPIQHMLVLHRIDHELRVARFYSLMIERDLFGTIRLVRTCGVVGINGREKVEEYPSNLEAGAALEAIARTASARIQI